MKINNKLALYLNIEESPTSFPCIFCNSQCILSKEIYISIIRCNNQYCSYKFYIKTYNYSHEQFKDDNYTSILRFQIPNIEVIMFFKAQSEDYIKIKPIGSTSSLHNIQPFDFTNNESLTVEIKTLLLFK